MQEPSTIIDSICRLVADSPTRSVPGVILGSAIRVRHPDFKPLDHGCQNFRTFVETFANGKIMCKDLNSIDLLYVLPEPCNTSSVANSSTLGTPTECKTELETTSEEQSRASKPAINSDQLSKLPKVVLPKEVWLALTSLSPTSSVWGNKNTGDIRLDSHAAELGPDCTRVPPINAAAHISIAKSFVSSLPSDRRSEVEALIDGTKRWWDKFFLKLQAISAEEANRWKRFHNEQVLQKIFENLSRLEIPVQKVAANYSTGQFSPYPTRPLAISRNPGSNLAQAHRLDSPEVIDAVATICISIGQLLQALKQRH